MANGATFSVTDEQISTLSDGSKKELAGFIDRVGPGSEAIPGYYQRLAARDVRLLISPEAPKEEDLTPAVRIQDTDVDTARKNAYINQVKMNVDSGMSVEDAESKATRAIQEIERQAKGVTLEGSVTSQLSQDDSDIIKTSNNPIELAKAVIRPKVVRVNTPETEVEKKTRKMIMLRFITEPISIANQDADRKKLGGSEREEYVEKRIQTIRNIRTRDVFREIYYEKKQAFIRGTPELEGLNIGRYESLPEKFADKETALREEATKERDVFVKDMFPRDLELFGEDPGLVEKIRDVSEEGNVVERNLAKAALLSGRLAKRAVRREDDETGAVSETYFGASTRVLFELLSPRAITYPILKSLTWDKNPETGLPYDPEDPRYLLQKRLDEQLEQMYQNAYDRSQGRDPSFPDVDTGKPGQLLGLQRSLTSGLNIESDMNTGSDFRDYLLTIANAEWSGSDHARLENMDNVPGIFPALTGFAVEIGAPVKFMPLAAGSKAVKSLTKITSSRAAKIASGLEFDEAGEFLKNVNRWADSELSLAETLAARRAYKDAMKAQGRAVTKSDIRAVEGYEDFAGKMAPSIADGIATVKVGADPLQAKAFIGIPENSAFARTIRMIAQKRDQLGVALKKSNPRAVLSKTPVGRELRVHLEEVVRAAPRASDKSIGQMVLISIAKTEMAGLLQDAIPTGWMRVSRNMVVRKKAYLANKEKIDSRAASFSDVEVGTLGGKEMFRYTDSTKSYVAAVAGGGARAYSKANVEALNKIKAGEWLTASEYGRMQTYIVDSAVESVLGAVGKSPIKSRNITEKVYKSARKGAVDREIAIIDGTKDFFRGVRSTMMGKSPIIQDMYPTSGMGKLVNADIRTFNKKIDPAVAETFEELTNRLNELPNTINKGISSGKPGEADDLVRSVATENPINDYTEFVELFFGPLEGSIGELFTKTNGDSFLENTITAALQTGVLPKTIDLKGMRKVIELVYEGAGTGELLIRLKNTAVKKGRFGWIGANSTDNIGMAASAYVIGKKAGPLYDEAVDSLNLIEEGLFIRIPEKTAKNGYAYRAEILRPILLTNGVDPKLAEELVESFKVSVSDTFSPTHLKRIAKDVVEYTVGTGFLPGAAQHGQMYQAILKGVSKTTHAGQGLKSNWGRLDEIIMRAFPDDAAKAQRTKETVANAYVEALTNIDTDRIYSLFNQQGILPNVGKAEEFGGARNTAPSFVDMRGTDLSYLGPQMADNMMQYSKFDKFARVNKHLAEFRPEHRAGGIILSDAIPWTRKMTISGLLAGWGFFPGLRYMSQNAITAPFIAAVSAPSMLMKTITTVPSAMAGGVMRGLRQAGFVRTSDVFNPTTRELVGLGEVVLVQPNGKVWTKSMIEEASNRQNIRYSRSTYDFQVDVLRESQRQMRVGPNGKPIYEMDVFGGKYAGANPEQIADFWDWFRPDRKNLFSIIAEQTDNVQREAAFLNALRIGSDEKTAGLLARNSMLDYGALPRWTQKAASRWLAFFAFRYRMTADLTTALLKGGEGARNVGRTGAIIKSQFEDMQEWVVTPDYLKTRLWKRHGKDFQRYIARQYGPNVPWSEGLMLLGNMHELFLNDERPLLDKLGTNFLGLFDQLDPRIQSVIDIYEESNKLTGTNFAPEGFVPSAFLLSSKTIPGGFEMAKTWYDLIPVPREKERPDLPTVDGRQWKFGPGGKLKFAAMNMLQLSTGNKRWIEDYTRLFGRMGLQRDGIEFKKDGEGNPIAFMLGETTASILKNPEYIRLAQDQFRYFAYRQMSKSP